MTSPGQPTMAAKDQPGGSSFAPLQRLFERDDRAPAARGGGLPWALKQLYGGELSIPLRSDGPTVIANFVSTIDGVVALDDQGTTGGGEVSGFYEPDRFVMGLLRTVADVVMVGAGTVRAAPAHRWTPAHVHRASADAFAAWRLSLGISAPVPTTMIVTRRGQVDPAHAGLADPGIPVVLVTSPDGARQLAGAAFGPHVRIVVDRSSDLATAALKIASHELRARVVLCEGGPHLLGELLERRQLHELFLTIAPQIVGRADSVGRLGLVEGRAFSPPTAPWSDLVSVTSSSDHLFLRYRFRDPGPADTREDR